MNYATVVTATYIVDGETYCIKERLKYKIEPIKIGFLPIGQRSEPKVKCCNVGDEVTILYDINNPKKGHIKGNDGIIT